MCGKYSHPPTSCRLSLSPATPCSLLSVHSVYCRNILMDLTRKCKSWAGKVCHQFESVCQDVDDFMSKDTMSFVENQVHSVGKRSYSDVVQDVHPHSKDDDDDQGTMIVSEKQLSENQGPIGNFRKSDASLGMRVETNELLSGTLNEVCKNLTPVMHVEGLITEDDKNTLSRDVLFDNNLLVVEDSNSDESGSRPNTTISVADKMGSPDYSTSDLARRASGIDWTLCDVSSEVESFDETKTLDVLTAMEGSDFVSGFSEKHNKDVLSKVEMTPSETGTYVMHHDMETVDLSPDMKHDETRIILNGNSVYAAFGGKRNFRYYKKLIQDALTSRKRLSKEYEHLSILYGDVESESSHHFVPISVPSVTNTSVHAVRTESFEEMSENEWELV